MNRWKFTKKLLIIIVAFLILSITIPMILEFVVYRNSFNSAISNGEWSSFFGSFIGGLISGIGTLVAVYITTKETRKIQDETQKSVDYDRSVRAIQERKSFVNEIVRLMAEYIADISAYFYANREIERLFREQKRFLDEIVDIDKKIAETNSLMKTMVDENNKIIKYSCDIEKLDADRHALTMKKERVDKKIENIDVDRHNANRCLFLIEMYLNNLETATELLKKLHYVHEISATGNEYNIEKFSVDTKKLQTLTIDFSNKYVKV